MSKPTVNVVKLEGVIKNNPKSGLNMTRYRPILDKAFATGRKRAALVVLHVSSPGGSPKLLKRR